MLPRLSLLLVLCLTLAASQAADSIEREKDVYRIYSLLMKDPATSHGPDNNPRYLIGAITRVEHAQPCVRPPEDRKAEFAEVLADFEARRSAARVLKRELSLRKPYELLSDEQVKAFQSERGLRTSADREPDPQFKGVADLFTLSNVYFSKNGRLALTAISTWCGGLCGQHQWKVLEKLPTDEWREQASWVSCFTIAHRLSPVGTMSLLTGRFSGHSSQVRDWALEALWFPASFGCTRPKSTIRDHCGTSSDES